MLSAGLFLDAEDRRAGGASGRCECVVLLKAAFSNELVKSLSFGDFGVTQRRPEL